MNLWHLFLWRVSSTKFNKCPRIPASLPRHGCNKENIVGGGAHEAKKLLPSKEMTLMICACSMGQSGFLYLSRLTSGLALR